MDIEFYCNLCGRQNRCERSLLGREVASCSSCRSSVRTRAIIHMLSRELFGASIALPDFPRLKAIRGMGTSDSQDYADRLAEKFDYRNTYYHTAPEFDIVNPPESELGAYDFIITSEVLEHVSPPVETAFRNIFRLLKPHGVLLMTVPYTLDGATQEHFPALHDWGLAQLSDRVVLVNRTAAGEIQTHEGLVFHGGGGSTLEMRQFTEGDLRRIMAEAGFSSVQVYGESYATFGVVQSEEWSLPMAARKEPFALRVAGLRELMSQWLPWVDKARSLEREVAALRAQIEEWKAHSDWAAKTIADGEQELRERTEWALRLEGELKERTEWALHQEKEVEQHVEIARQLQAELNERTLWATSLDAENKSLRKRLEHVSRGFWMKAGRALRFIR